MEKEITMVDWIEHYQMRPHPEGGFYRELWTSERACQIHYLLGPGETGAWHRIQSEEIWLWHSGGMALFRLGGSGEKPQAEQWQRLGPQGPFFVRVPANVWQQARSGGDFVLFSCITTPPYCGDELELYREEP